MFFANLPVSVARTLELPPNEVIYEIKPSGSFIFEPAALETSYIQKALVPNLTDHAIEGRLYDLLKKE